MTSPLQQKIRISGPSIVTANRTWDGVVIYRTAVGWSERLGDAAIVSDAEAARAMLNDAIADDLGAIGAYIAPVQIESASIKPGNLRESIRQNGVTVGLLDA